MSDGSVAVGKTAPGTDVQLWGSSWWFGSDALILGNSSSVSGFSAPITSLNHDSALRQISTFNGQYAWSNYAAADLYITAVCAAIPHPAPLSSPPASGAFPRKPRFVASGSPPFI